MVKNKGYITLVRIVVLVTFFLTIVLDQKSDAKETLYVRLARSKNQFSTNSSLKLLADSSVVITPPAAKNKLFSSPLHPGNPESSVHIRYNFYHSKIQPFFVFTPPAKIRGIHPINGPPDALSSSGNTEHQPLKFEASNQSPADSCIQIPKTVLSVFNETPLFVAALPGSDFKFLVRNEGYSLPNHSAGQAPALDCPEDISTYTDINDCSAFVSGGLNPGFDESEVVTLTWEMEGAMEDASPSGGINLIDDYTFDEGTTIITYTATGTDGLATTCMFTVTISDNQVPRLESIPADITVETAPGTCYARVYWIEPTAIDNCTPLHLIRKESTNRPGDEFPAGTTRVYYTAFDAMGNESQVQSFAITVRDTEAPELFMPADVTLECGNEIPAPWQTLQQFTAAGGSVTDNCSHEEIAFRLLAETTSSPVCPYVLTRTYQATDAAGNSATAVHRIVVTGTQPTDAVVTEPEEEEVRLKSGMAAIISTGTGGAWNDPNTWVGGVVPDPDDDVTIASNATVTVDDVTIGGSLTLENGSSLEVSGNWTNNGSFSAGTNSNVTFTGTASPVSIGGTSTTVFKNFELDKGSGNILAVNSNIELDGTITFTSGIMQINSGASVICTHNAGFTIEENAGMVIAGGTFTSGAFTITNRGLFQIDNGTVNIGTVSGNSLFVGNAGTFLMNNGTLNVAGRLQISGGTATVNGGTINLNTVGHSSSSFATLDLTATSVFNMTGGTINFLQPNGSGNLDLSILSGGTKTFGGTLNFGTGTYRISSNTLFPAFTSSGSADIILRIPVSANGTYTFPLTTSGGNSIPATVAITATSYNIGAYIEITSLEGKHPENKNTTNFLNRYWTITTSGITITNYDVTVNYLSTDIAGTESAIAAGLWTGSLPWQKGNVASSNTITFSGITANSAEITGITLAPPTVEINGGNASETICNDGTSSVTLTAVATGDEPFTYSWNPATGLSAANIENPVASPTATTIYEVTVTDGNGFTATDDIEVIVDPQSVGGTIAGSATVCSGTNSTLLTLSGYTGTIQNWEYSIDGGSIWTAIANTNDTYTATNLTETTDFRAVVKSGVCSETASAEATITVDPVSEGGTIAGGTTVCSGTNSTLLTLSGYVGTVQNWEYSTDGGSTWTDIASTSDTYTATDLTQTTSYRAVVKSGVCNEAVSDEASITVDPLSVGGTIAGGTTVCSGTNSTQLTLSGYIGIIQNWEYSTDGGSTWTDIASTSDTYTATDLTQTTSYRAVVQSGVCSEAISAEEIITVDPQSDPGTASATNSVICSGETTTLNLAGYTGTIQWQQSADGTTGWANVSGGSGATTDDYTTPALTETTFYRALVTSGVCTDVASNTVEITVNTPPVLTECPALPLIVNTDPGVCSAVVNYTVTASGSPAPDYSWEFSGATVAAGSGTGSGSAFNKGITNVTVTATNSCGSEICEFTIEVEDNEAPVKPTLSPIFEDCTVSLADYPAPTTTDNCDGIITGTTTTVFPITTQGITTVTWTFTDSEGNFTTANQNVSINDNVSPVWDNLSFFTSILNLSCDDDTTATGIGYPTATDNCSPVSISYTQIVNNISCPGTYQIHRTWTAADTSGNTNTRVQRIYVTDTEKPILICRDTTVANPDAIFSASLLAGLSFYDNCGIDTVFLMNEYYTFDDGNSAGFCPETVVREYVVYDQCGNVSLRCTQTITVSDPGDCEVCQEQVPYYLANLNGAPDSLWISPEHRRAGLCCETTGPPPPRCTSFNVYLDEDAVGLVFDIYSGAPPPGALYYQVDCGPEIHVGEEICLAGGQFYTVTFCKPGNNQNEYSIQSIKGAATPDSLTTRADVDCFGELYVTGLEPSTIVWSVKYPSGSSHLLNYLDTTDPENPTFYPDENTPALIIYEVCGTVLGAPQCDGVLMTDCAEVIVNVLRPININLDQDLVAVCEGNIPGITAEIPNEDPSLTYTFEWYDGPDSTGNLVGTNRFFQPTDSGSYSVVVKEISSGVNCGQDIANFNITYDVDGPVLLTPPDTLFLECTQADFEIAILNWIALAEAYDMEETPVSVNVQNDYSPFDPSCGHIEMVRFWAEDICGNFSIDSAYIYVNDELPPVITTEAADASSDCSTLNPEDDPGYLDWLAINGGAAATDDCDDDATLTWSNNSDTQTWSGDPANNQITITFTVTDDCGNTAETTAIYSIIDDEPPTITCPDDVTEEAAANECSKILATPTDPTLSDICSDPVLTWIMNGATTGTGTGTVTSETFNVGVTTVTYFATDAAGLTDSCNFTVTIIDVTPPNIVISNCQDVTGTMDADDCFALPPSMNDPLYSDDCWPLDSLVLSFEITGAWDTTGIGYVSNFEFPVGISTVTYTVTDPDENSEECSFTVTMLRDEIPWTAITCPPVPAPVTLGPTDCEATISLDPPTIDDFCVTATYTITNSYNGSSEIVDEIFPTGTTRVAWYIEDNSGNIDSCIVFVEVDGIQLPTIACPPSVSGTMDATGCYAVPPAIDPPIYSAPCWDTDSLELTFRIENGAWDTTGVGEVVALEFPAGTNTVWYIVTDPDGNKDSCAFTVSILRDAIPSTAINCPPNPAPVTLGATECEATITLDPPTITDFCVTATYTITNSYNGGPDIVNEIFPTGTTRVVWYIEDNSGNKDSCIVYVEVDGIQLPTIACPPSVSGTMDATGCYAIPPAIDPPIYSAPCWDTDSLELTFRIENGAWDTTGVGEVVALEFPAGTNTVWYIVTDPDGNKDSCAFTVSILRDAIPSTAINCPPNPAPVTLGATECEATITLAPPTITDFCVTATYTITNSYNGGPEIVDEIFQTGTTRVVWYIEDNSGNIDSCIVYVEVDGIQLPTIACPPNVTGTMDATGCFALPPTIEEPNYSAPCWDTDSLTLTFRIENGGWDTTGVNLIPADLEFPVGTNIVTYIVTDPDGNADSCSFFVTMLHDEIPSTVFNCPVNPGDVTVDSTSCNAYVVIEAPTINEHCVTATYTITHDSPYGTDSSDASGYYPIGVHTVTWTISDNSNNETTCVQTFEVFDLEPVLECPPSIEVFADENELFATGVTVGLPMFQDNCDSTLIYTITPPDSITTIYNSDPSGINILTGSHTYNLGVTTIWYIFEDGHGHIDSCFFTVTVLAAPEIECPPDTTIYLDGSEATCDVTFDPGVADLIQGAPSITWTYTINFADGSTEGPVTYVKDASDPYANPLGNRIFPLGLTTIEWRAENEAGFDTCSHWIHVIDTIPPTFTSKDFEDCVDPLHWATYDPTSPNPIVNHIDPNLDKYPSPDFRTLPAGSTELDITDLDDNCCDPATITINWRIDFTDVTHPVTGATLSHPSVSGTGQPSTYGSDIQLWGDGVTFYSVTHTITYWVEDCNGNISDEQEQDIVITPRPQIIKVTGP